MNPVSICSLDLEPSTTLHPEQTEYNYATPLKLRNTLMSRCLFLRRASLENTFVVLLCTAKFFLSYDSIVKYRLAGFFKLILECHIYDSQ